MRSVIARVLLSTASALAIAMVLTSGFSAVYGQARLTANVPFSFRTVSTAAPAGHYEINPNYMAGVTMLHNTDTNNWVPIVRQGAIYSSKDSRPRLVFRCTSSECALSQIFTGSDGWQLTAPKLTPAEKERLAVVYFTDSKSE